MADNKIASIIDHTLLKPEVTKAQIIQLCQEAKTYQFASVCVNPTWVKTCADLLQESRVKVCTVIGFPLGATTPEVKAFETREVIKQGATEVDMVINIGALKDGNDTLVERDIKGVVESAKEKALVKVIIETGLLSEEEKVRACFISRNAGADYVKTATGFSNGAATEEDIQLIRKTVGPEMGVKASGGVLDRETAVAMINSGATRIGASSSVAIVTGEEAGTGKGTGY